MACERLLPEIAQQQDVPIAVLLAVGLTETGKGGFLHPYALNIEGRTVIRSSAAEALQEFAAARKSGKRLIDLGCMQVNHHYHGANFRSVADMIDPRKNITYAAQLLKSLQAQQGSWTAAIALYHASPRKPAEQRRYVCTVIANLSASGFGRWTPESRRYCRRK